MLCVDPAAANALSGHDENSSTKVGTSLMLEAVQRQSNREIVEPDETCKAGDHF